MKCRDRKREKKTRHVKHYNKIAQLQLNDQFTYAWITPFCYRLHMHHHHHIYIYIYLQYQYTRTQFCIRNCYGLYLSANIVGSTIDNYFIIIIVVFNFVSAIIRCTLVYAKAHALTNFLPFCFFAHASSQKIYIHLFV